jgi:hypothetical protein
MDSITIVLDNIDPPNSAFLPVFASLFPNSYTITSGTNFIVAPTDASHLGVSIIKA